MQIEFIKALWGMEGMPIEDSLAWVADNGYTGFETVLDTAKKAQGKHNLKLVTLGFVEDLDSVKRDLAQAIELGAVLMNFHAGKDWFTFGQGADFFEGALLEVAQSPIPVCFETHRGRILYNPGITAEYVRRFPELRLAADFSHWTCVCESMLGDQEYSLATAIQAVGHIHARVGHEQGPQVPDPRVPQWEGHVKVFEGWWDRMVDAARSRGDEAILVDPEFGPPNYLWTDPQTGNPLSDLLEVCNWMKDRLSVRWA